MAKEILKINNLSVDYKTSNLGQSTIFRAVDNVSFSINEGEIFAIAGESGCGKSTLSKAIIKLVPIADGEINYNDMSVGGLKGKDLKTFRQNVQMIFQNPYASLNPKLKIEEILSEPLIINTKLSKKEISKIVSEKFEQVGLSQEQLKLYPHEFSGGQRQRIAIARALMLNPKFIIADEPVSGLDASIQAQIINLINDLKKELGITILFISHDLRVINYLADRIGIMYLGELVEIGTKDEIFNDARHPYTKALLDAVPSMDKKSEKVLLGDFPTEVPKGCRFSTRCTVSEEKCSKEKPVYIEVTPTHKYACFK